MKAIETIYNNYRFRSRIEARWAVFFDVLGIEYYYEPEGFELGDGMRYLPDFWLPKQKYWIEIKGQEPTEEEHEKVGKFALQLQEAQVFMFIGEIPTIPADYVIEQTNRVWGPRKGFNARKYTSREGYFDRVMWAQCPFCGKLGIDYNGWGLNLPCCKMTSQEGPLYALENRIADNLQSPVPSMEQYMFRKVNDLFCCYDTPQLTVAYTAARQARFEHGEKGTDKFTRRKNTNGSKPEEKPYSAADAMYPYQYKDKTLSAFNVVVPGVQDAFNESVNYVTNHERIWLIIGGNKLPTGKTHLAAAIANEFIKQNKSVCFVFPGDLLDIFWNPGLKANEFFETAAKTDLLVLDDYGRHNQEEGPQDMLWRLLAYRSENGLPTVFATPMDTLKLPTHPRTQIQITSLKQAGDYYRYNLIKPRTHF